MISQRKARVIIELTVIGLIGVFYTVSSAILSNSLNHAEEHSTRQAVDGVINTFKQNEEDFTFRFADWSAWDELYTFVDNGNQAFLTSNLIAETLANLKINLVLFTQPSGKIVFGTGFDRNRRTKTSIPAPLFKHLAAHARRLQPLTPNSNLTGIILLPPGPMLITARPILTSQSKGPIRGTAIFGRYLSEIAIEHSSSDRLPLTIHRLDEALPPDFRSALSALSAQSVWIHPLSEQTISGYTILKDIYGQPALLLRIDVPRDIYQQRQQDLRYLAATLLLIGLVFGSIIFWLLQRLTVTLKASQTVESALQQAEENYRSIFKHAITGIFQTTPEGKYLRANPALAHIYGYVSPEEMIAEVTNIEEQLYVDPHRRQEFIALLQQHGKLSKFESQIYRRDRQVIWISETARAVRNQNGELLYYEGFVSDITEYKQAEEQLRHDALHDALTGLPNRILFINRLEHALQAVQVRENYFFAVLFVDLDGFKLINDSLGHLVGDQLLIKLAERLSYCLRARDTFARLGGDEFAILLEDVKDEHSITQIVERIQQELKLSFNLSGQEVFVTASIGSALSSATYSRPEELLRDADTAMYRAKALGRSRYEPFSPAMHDLALARLYLETDLRRAIENREFQLYYQPIVSLRTNRMSGFEALIRWHHPKRGLISPLEFIPVAEETGLILPLGDWILREACQQLKHWKTQFSAQPHLTMNVNISAKQFSQPNLVEYIQKILEEASLDTSSLKLEITESTIMENAESANGMLQQLKALGVQLSIDDFGTGYSSLGYLHRFPIQTLKIDRSFVNSMEGDLEKLEIIRTIVTLAWNLGLEVVAEGVETKKQLAQLKALNCEFGQGYLFSKPLNSEAATLLLAEANGVIKIV